MSFVLSVYINNLYYPLALDEGSRVTIGSSKRDTLSLPDTGLVDAQFIFSLQKEIATLSAKPGVYSNGTEIHDATITVGDVFSFNNLSIYICPKQADYERSVTLSGGEFIIGRGRECALCLSNKRVSTRHTKIAFESGKYKVIDLDSKNHTFVNGKRISTHYLQDGDTISIAYYSIVYENGQLTFLNVGEDLKLNLDEKSIVRRYPLFRRSPRLGYITEQRTIEIESPPPIQEKPQVNWLVVFLPPLVMIGVSVASMILTESSVTNLLFILPMSLVTLLTTIISYFAQVRKHNRDIKKKRSSYGEYAKKVVAEVGVSYAQQLSSTNSANPDTEYCYDIVSSRMRRLWERSSGDADFLNARLGRGTLPLNVEVIQPKTSVGEEINPQLAQLQKEIAPLSSVRDIAITLPLKDARTIGVVGNRQVAVKTIQNIIVQLATHHSYVDANIVVIASEKDYEQWSWVRWLPHVWSNDRQVRFISSDHKQAFELLSSFEDVLKKRVAHLSDHNYLDGSIMLPYLIFVITDYALIENRDFMRLILTAESGIGVSAFLLFDSLSKLPKECDWFVELSNSGGNVYSKNDSGNKIAFSLDPSIDYEKFARSMAPVRDKNASTNGQLPASVTFFQGYGVGEASEIDLIHNWNTARSHKSLAAPIGIKENGKPFIFDIHEKAHGPHGLVAGTTGSGKSEVLQTWILSMCANYSPQDVSFVLIDFKGMGLAGTLKGLPHIAGTISDVDENIQRNLFSLESELSRRKMLFANVSTESMKIGDIYDYQEAYQQGKVSEPLSHLIVVVDEFAELKSKFPDFMAALDSAARVGRSLGVHLVLATQKPDGVVTDEVRANSKFKWCLKVANETESKAVISRPEAASIPISAPGRAYIQIGNNEVFELIQTYYSGAVIKRSGSAPSTTISFVDEIGHRERIRAIQQADESSQEKELLALVKWIITAHRMSGLPYARKVWEESLPKRLALSDVVEPENKSLLSAVIGLVDDPRHQKQYPCQIDFAVDGHIIIYGAPATGKTILLQTLAMSLAVSYTPDEVNIYIMDFGSWSMKNLQSLPHIGGVANGNESEKIINLVKMLSETLDKRKTLFAQIGASNLEAYRQASGQIIPSIVVMVDNFAPIRELYPDIENVFVRLSREGSSYGVFLVITATSLSGSIGYNLSQNFKQALSLRMTEKADYRDIVGDTEGLEPSKVAGRGLVRGKPPMEFQTALAVQASNDVEYVAKLKEACSKIASEWHGNLPLEIPIMPEVVLFQHCKNVASDRCVIGLSNDEIRPVVIPKDSRIAIISGTEASGKTNMLTALAKQLGRGENIIYVSAANDEYAGKTIVEAIRKADAGERITLLIDDLPFWMASAEYNDVDLLESLIRDVRNNNFTLYATGDAAELTQVGGNVVGKISQLGYTILLGGSFNEHSSQFEANNISYTEQSEQLPLYCGYLIQKKKAVKFKAVFAGGCEHGV